MYMVVELAVPDVFHPLALYGGSQRPTQRCHASLGRALTHHLVAVHVPAVQLME